MSNGKYVITKNNLLLLIGQSHWYMKSIKEVLAKNLKINRLKLGLTQDKLAEKADISTHYLAMVELTRKFPSADMLERLAMALEIEPHELFYMPNNRIEPFSLTRASPAAKCQSTPFDSGCAEHATRLAPYSKFFVNRRKAPVLSQGRLCRVI